MLFRLFLDNWLIIFNSCNDCTNFNPTGEPIMPTGTLTNDANAGIETQSVTVEAKISKCSA